MAHILSEIYNRWVGYTKEIFLDKKKPFAKDIPQLKNSMGYHGSFFSERLYNNPQSKNEENKGLRAVATTSFPWMKGCESSGLTRSTRMISAAGGKSPCQTSFWLPRPYG